MDFAMLAVLVVLALFCLLVIAEVTAGLLRAARQGGLD